MGQTWTEYFFQDCPPSLVKLFRESPQDPESFKRFECNGSWRLGKPLRTDMPPGHTIMVLPLTVREGNSKDPRYVAKTFSDFTIEQAETHIRTSGLSLRRSSNYSPQEVQSQLDPFLVEARVFEHIQHHCPESQKIFFPRYLGVLADIPRRKYPMSCLLRRRAVVMERIYPDLASRRILAAAASPTSPAEIHWINVDHDHDPMQRLHQELHNIPCISPFEITWYESLLSDRLRRTTCLHDIGIIHGDIRDDHFRIPGDFYDTVLYDFSASYVFSPSIPCRWRLRRLWDLRRDEREMLWQIVLERAERFDFRHYLATSLELSLDTITELCFENEGTDADLEMMVFRVTNRPDAFTMPSLVSTFPFLEGIRRPENPHSQTWHIRRAKMLQYYDCAWIVYSGQTTELSLIAHGGDVHFDEQGLDTEGKYFFLILFPQSWDKKEVEGKFVAVCNRVILSGEVGSVITRMEFGGM